MGSTQWRSETMRQLVADVLKPWSLILALWSIRRCLSHWNRIEMLVLSLVSVTITVSAELNSETSLKSMLMLSEPMWW